MKRNLKHFESNIHDFYMKSISKNSRNTTNVNVTIGGDKTPLPWTKYAFHLSPKRSHQLGTNTNINQQRLLFDHERALNLPRRPQSAKLSTSLNHHRQFQYKKANTMHNFNTYSLGGNSDGESFTSDSENQFGDHKFTSKNAQSQFDRTNSKSYLTYDEERSPIKRPFSTSDQESKNQSENYNFHAANLTRKDIKQKMVKNIYGFEDVKSPKDKLDNLSNQSFI